MGKGLYSPEWAELTKEQVGEKYRPSNHSEGELFFGWWCRRCQRDKAMREGVDIDECDDNERCDIIANTFRYKVDDEEYPVEWQYRDDGQPCCTAFVEAGQPIPEPHCPHTQELFK